MERIKITQESLSGFIRTRHAIGWEYSDDEEEIAVE